MVTLSTFSLLRYGRETVGSGFPKLLIDIVVTIIKAIFQQFSWQEVHVTGAQRGIGMQLV